MQLTSVQIIDGLRHQLNAYWCNEWLFDQQVNDNNPLTALFIETRNSINKKKFCVSVWLLFVTVWLQPQMISTHLLGPTIGYHS
jgi:hypothetical protein